jgi:predicted nucleic acid-binding protein
MAARRKKKATKRKASKRKATRSRKATVANLVVNSKVKEAVKSHGYRMAGDFGEALNARVGDMIHAAVARCEANGRGTVRPQDL